jgi:hypothetical protein
MSYAIACNVVDPRCAYIAEGSKAFVIYWADSPRIGVVVHTRSGRWATKWIHVKQLANFRAKWLEPALFSHGVNRRDTPVTFETKELAESVAENFVRLLENQNRPPSPGV